MEYKNIYTMQDLMQIVKQLRDPINGCPWDKAQTHLSIRQNFLEETYEVADAIDMNDAYLLCEELGDVLLQIALHTQMEDEAGNFTIDDVTTGVCKKLIERHPHIFAQTKADTPEQVLNNWEEIKRKEKKRNTAQDNLLSVPRALPGLMRGQKIQKRAAEYGFCYSSVKQAVKDLESEIAELNNALNSQNENEIKHEIADVVFSAVNVARMNKIDAEEAVQHCNDRFTNRVIKVEQLALQQGKTLQDLNEQELDILWKKAKVLTKP